METHDALSKPTFFLESEKALASFLNHPSNIENGKKKQNISRKTKSAFGAATNGASCETKKKQSKTVFVNINIEVIENRERAITQY